MARMKNNDIYISRGETAALNFRIWNDDGTPFILPPRPAELNIRALADIKGDRYNFHCPIKAETITVYSESGNNEILITLFTSGAPITVHHGITISVNDIVTAIWCPDSPISKIVCGYENGSIVISNSNQLTVLVLTVRAGMYDYVMTEKLINGSAAITKNGKTDYTLNGLSKFTTNEILEKETIPELKLALEEQFPDIIQVGKVGNDYYQLSLLKNGIFELVPYEFNISIPLEYADTDFEAGEYTYDFVAYNGVASDELFTNDILSFNKLYWKKELVKPHKFIIGDSHNA